MNKVCTTIEQSKKLIELGINVNTADMYWWSSGKRYYIEAMDDDDFNEEEGHIPAWSLAALLNLLPNNEHIETTISRGGWEIEPVEYLPNTWWCEYEDTKNQTEFNISADNPVDACYEMIIKLNELKML